MCLLWNPSIEASDELHLVNKICGMFLLILFRDIPNETHELAKEVLLCGAVGCHLCTQFSALAASVESEKSQSLIFGCWRRLAMSWSVHSGWSFQQMVDSRGITGSAVAVAAATVPAFLLVLVAPVTGMLLVFFSACQRDAL